MLIILPKGVYEDTLEQNMIGFGLEIFWPHLKAS
jgi:hypothetical protein